MERSDEPKEPRRTPVTQSMFSRRPPSSEDDYFYEQEHKALHQAEELELGAAPPVHQRPPEERPPGKFWQKIIRALSWKSDTNWRP